MWRGWRISSVATVGLAVRLEPRLRDGRARVMRDPGELESELLNPCINARDAMPESGQLTINTADIRLSAEDVTGHGEAGSGDYVEISIPDTGHGMPAEVAKHAFEPFFATKPLGHGTGLGLSQVYGFARQSGGTATIESQPGQGTVVTLFLPCGTLVPPAAAASAQNEAPIGAGRRALVVEDNPGVADATRNHLEQLGFVVAVADRAAAALRLVEADPPDLVLSDIVMPGGNGLDLAREIRRRWPRIPVVLATGFSESAEQAGRDGFTILRKPYDIERLRGALLAVLPALATTD